MAQAGETFDIYDATGVREDLTDIIYNISPTDTPFFSSIGKSKATQHLHQWQLDSLATAAENKHVDGDEFAGTAITATSVLGNYCQISKKNVVVSGRAEVADKAGRRSEMAYQMAKAGKELKRDVEFACVASKNNATVGTSSSAPTACGLLSTITTNEALNSSDSAVVTPLNSGTMGSRQIVDAASLNGFSFDESVFDGVVRGAFTEGGDPQYVMCHPISKSILSDYYLGTTAKVAAVQGPRAGAGAASAVGAIDVFISDFGTMRIIPNRIMRSAAREIFIIDPDYWGIAYLRPFQTVNIASTGDAEKKTMMVDWTLVGKNEAASGIMKDLDSGAAAQA